LLPATHPTAHKDMPAGVVRRLSFLYPPHQSPVFPKLSAVASPLAIRSKDAAKDMWGNKVTGCSLAPPLFPLQAVATGQCTPFRRGGKSLPGFVDVIEYWLGLLGLL
jgi:hypothetical protein